MRILEFIVELSVVLSFFIKSELFIIELNSHGDWKVSNQHAPLTDAELFIFPELLFSSSDKPCPLRRTFICPCYTIPSPGVREQCAAPCIMYLYILPGSVVKVQEWIVQGFCKDVRKGEVKVRIHCFTVRFFTFLFVIKAGLAGFMCQQFVFIFPNVYNTYTCSRCLAVVDCSLAAQCGGKSFKIRKEA